MRENKNYRTLVLLLLTLVYAFNFIDRQIIGILSPFIQADLGLTNTQMGLLKGFLFALFYTVTALPIAWLADRYNRVNIIATSLAVWSAFTAFTGMAGNFVQIGLARIGVGIGEAGGSPPSHSIISDLYPKEKRSGALAIYALGIPIGLGFAYFVAGIALGNPDSSFNWRNLLIWLGIAGVVLAVVVRLVIREPKRGAQEAKKAGKAPSSPPFIEALKVLLSIPSWWAMCLGIACASFAGYAFSTWQIDYLLPFDHQAENPVGFKSMMFTLGFINMFAYGFGTWFGGYLADRFAKKNNNVSAYALVPMITVLCALPLAVLAFWVPTIWAHMVVVSVFVVFLGMYLGPSFAIAQTLAPINMRAMSTALFFLILNIIALGGGPTLVGILIDVFEPEHGKVHAIRISMTFISVSLILSAISFLFAAKNLPKDWANAEKRNEGLANQDS